MNKTRKKIQYGKGKKKTKPKSYHRRQTIKHDKERRKISTNYTPVRASNSPYYNANPYMRESHNCYTYFLDLRSKEAFELCKDDLEKHNMCRRAQPGYLSGFDKLGDNDYTCPEIEKRTMKDNPSIYKLNSIKDKCDPRFYKGAMVTAPGRDYHYYRLNDEGIWTHKPGYKPITKYDSNNRRIIDPELAARDYGGTLNYKNFCGYYCVPRNRNKKNMTHSNNWRNKKHYLKNVRNYEKHYNLLNKLNIKNNNNTHRILGKRTVNILQNNRTRKNS